MKTFMLICSDFLFYAEENENIPFVFQPFHSHGDRVPQELAFLETSKLIIINLLKRENEMESKTL